MKLSGKRVLVTGAAGFIGSHVSDRLADGNELLLVDDFSTGARENLEAISALANVRVEEADIRDRERMLALCEGIDVVLHLAVSCLRTSLGAPESSHDVNAGGTLSVCLAAREREVERFVYVSSSEVYGSAETVPMSESHPCRPTTVYGASKLAGEAYALAFWRTYGMAVSVVRPFNTYGPREPWRGARAEVIPRFVLQLLAGQAPVIFGSGAQTRDFTFVEDTASGIVAAAECDALVGDVVNVGCGREASVAFIAERLAQIIGRENLAPEYAAPRPGDVDRHYADVGKAKTLFGYEPRTELEAGLERTVDWFRDRNITVPAEGFGAPNW
ncbi:MAG: GDP-mannose 4,6-dehydratase [Proteobacteria bacterium]|nr:GDP-mannose 4,6-dehydratase [Pseudomonadota bacterium]